MSRSLDRRAFLCEIASLLAFGVAGCAKKGSAEESSSQMPESEELGEVDTLDREGETLDPVDSSEQEEAFMQITVTINDVPFTATIEDTEGGQELLARLPLTLSMEELHGNEKYCYTGEPFAGEQHVPQTIEAGDLMVFGSDCLVLFYETFANGGWSYQRLGRIDDPTGLADACGAGTASVTFAPLS